MKSVAWKLAAGVVVSIALGSIACATGGSRSTGATDAATPAESAQAQAPPPAPAAPTAAPAPAPAKPSEPAVAAPAAPSAPPAAASDSPVAGYLADPQAMTRASGSSAPFAPATATRRSRPPIAIAPNLFDCSWTHGSSDQEIFDTIAAGVPDTQMQGVRRAAAARGPVEAGGVPASEVDLQVAAPRLPPHARRTRCHGRRR